MSFTRGFAAGQRDESTDLELLPSARGIASSSKQDEYVHLELVLHDLDVERCSDYGPSGLGVLVALVGQEQTSPETKENWHYYVVALPAVCSVRNFQGSSRSLQLLQLRVNFGRLLDVFPELLERADLRRIASYALQFGLLGKVSPG